MAVTIEKAKVEEVLVNAGADGLTAEGIAASIGLDLAGMEKADKKRALSIIRSVSRTVVKDKGGRSVKGEGPFAQATYIVDGAAPANAGE